MSDPSDNPSAGEKRNQHRSTLQKIADSLGEPIDRLMQAAESDAYPDDTAELVRLWFKVRDGAVRREILNVIRRAAGEI